MNFITGLRDYRLAGALLMAAVLAGCGPSDDKSKDKKAEPPPPPKATPAPVPPKPAPAPVPPKKVEQAPPKAEKAIPKADAEGWFLLGQQQADHRTERERFEVGRGQSYRELRVTVQGAPLAISEMIVTFGNEKQFKPSIRQQFDSTASSQVINLPGDKRSIKHVDFVYRTSASGTGKATVMLHGR